MPLPTGVLEGGVRLSFPFARLEGPPQQRGTGASVGGPNAKSVPAVPKGRQRRRPCCKEKVEEEK